MTEPVSEIGSGGRLYSLESGPRDATVTAAPDSTKSRWSWPRRNTQKPLSGKTFRPNLRELGSNLAEIVAIGAVSHGFWLITPAAGWIAGGIGLAAVSIAMSRGGDSE